jgi:hypothetical protein
MSQKTLDSSILGVSFSISTARNSNWSLLVDSESRDYVFPMLDSGGGLEPHSVDAVPTVRGGRS